jgi:hypothetical protein
MAAPDMPKEWSMRELRNLIQEEVSSGQTMVVLNSAIASGELNTAVRAIARDAYASFESHAMQVASMAEEINSVKIQIDKTSTEVAFAKSETERILSDCNKFVEQVRLDSAAANAAMLLETNALHEKQQAIVHFVNGVPDTVAALRVNLDNVKEFLEASGVQSYGARISAVEVNYEEFESSSHRNIEEHLKKTAAAASQAGAGQGFQGAPFAERDRNVFDVRDYKLVDLQPKPSIGKWKKWRRDFEAFIDSIGVSWKGTSGLLRQLRHCESTFGAGQAQAWASTRARASRRR